MPDQLQQALEKLSKLDQIEQICLLSRRMTDELISLVSLNKPLVTIIILKTTESDKCISLIWM